MALIVPGWNPSPLKGVSIAASLSTITQVLSSTSSASTIAFPVGIVAGDLIVMLDRAGSASFDSVVPASVTPTGFTQIDTRTVVSGAAFRAFRQTLWYKKAVGTETGNLTGMNANINLKAMLVFRGNIAATTITVGSATGVGGIDTDPGDASVTASGGTPPLVVIGAYGSTGAISPTTFSTTKDGEVNPSTLLYLAWKIYNSSPANTTVGMDDEGNANTLNGCYIQMA